MRAYSHLAENCGVVSLDLGEIIGILRAMPVARRPRYAGGQCVRETETEQYVQESTNPVWSHVCQDVKYWNGSD